MNTLVTLDLAGILRPDDDALATRVEDVVPAPAASDPTAPPAPHRLVVSAPGFAGDVAGPPIGAAGTLSWLTDRGRWDLPVVLDRVQRNPAGVPFWELRTLGPVRRVQRRQFYRVPCSLPVELTLADSAPIRGRTQNLSEAGLRALIPGTELPEPGTALSADVDLGDGERLTLAGRVVSAAVISTGADGRVEVAMAFDEPERHGDALRAVVVREQLRQRRLATDG